MRKLWLILFAILFPLSVMAQSAAEISQQESDDRGFLTRLLERNLSSAGREVVIDGFQGALSSRATFDRITIADRDGVWLTLNDGAIQWNRSALFAQGGEFAFVLLDFSVQNGVLPRAGANLLVSVIALSMAVTPLAVILFDRLGDPESAEAAYHVCLTRAPSSLITKSNLAWLHVMTGRLDQAVELRSELEELEAAGLALLDAGIALAGDNFGSAVDLLDEALGTGLEGGGIHLFLGQEAEERRQAAHGRRRAEHHGADHPGQRQVEEGEQGSAGGSQTKGQRKQAGLEVADRVPPPVGRRMGHRPVRRRCGRAGPPSVPGAAAGTA